MKIKTHYQLPKLIAYSSSALLLGSLHAQESDPFVKKEGTAIAPSQTTVSKSSKGKVMASLLSLQQSQRLAKVISITFETFSLPASEAAKLRRLNISDAKMYEAIIKMVEENKAKLELFSIVRGINGEKTLREATQVYRRDVESETAESKTDAKATSKSESPEIKKAGLNMRVESLEHELGRFIPLTQKGAILLNGKLRDFASEKANPYRNDNFNDAAIEQKRKQFFEAVREGDIKVMSYIACVFKYSFSELPPLKTEARSAGSPNSVIDVNVIHAGVTLNAGDPFLLGTHTPASKLKENDNKEVWLCFGTGTFKKPGL